MALIGGFHRRRKAVRSAALGGCPRRRWPRRRSATVSHRRLSSQPHSTGPRLSVILPLSITDTFVFLVLRGGELNVLGCVEHCHALDYCNYCSEVQSARRSIPGSSSSRRLSVSPASTSGQTHQHPPIYVSAPARLALHPCLASCRSQRSRRPPTVRSLLPMAPPAGLQASYGYLRRPSLPPRPPPRRRRRL